MRFERNKTGTFNNREYQNEYHKSMKRISISFNHGNREDMKLYKFAMMKDNVTAYLKGLIRADMENNSK